MLRHDFLRFSVHSAFIKLSYNNSPCQVPSFLIQFYFNSVHLHDTYNAITFWKHYVIWFLFHFFLVNFFNFLFSLSSLFFEIFRFFFSYLLSLSARLFYMVVKSPCIFRHPLTLLLELFLPTQSYIYLPLILYYSLFCC